jgi:hypothetical protein
MPATYEPIATTTLTGTATSVTFSSISAAYTDLRLVFVPIASTGGVGARFSMNGDNGTNYSYTSIQGSGSSATSSQEPNVNYLSTVLASATTTIPTLATVDIFNYRGSTFKTLLYQGTSDMNGSGWVLRGVGLYRSTSPITSVTMTTGSNSYGIGTTATLYGILRA